MRALNIRTLRLESINPGEYAFVALSHTWDDHEPTYQDFVRNPKAVLQLPKIRGLVRLASGLLNKIDYDTYHPAVDHVWIDTICIDKTSSAELQEAINSMYAWYAQSYMCFVYLSDVHLAAGVDCRMGDVVPTASWPDIKPQFRSSRWFTRGWTLQELVAPKFVVFHTSSWQVIGFKGKPREAAAGYDDFPRGEVDYGKDLVSIIASTTGMPRDSLTSQRQLWKYSVAQRMSWACRRWTTRPEDNAYCLMGLFEVNMPMLYGEGGTAAFARLVGEIAKRYSDHSLFAYGYRCGLISTNYRDSRSYNGSSVPTWTVSEYRGCESVKSGSLSDFIREALPAPEMEHFTITNRGVHIELAVLELPAMPQLLVALLHCGFEETNDDGELRILALPLLQLRQPGLRTKLVVRRRNVAPVDLPLHALKSIRLADSSLRHTPIMTTRQLYISDQSNYSSTLGIFMRYNRFRVRDVCPPILPFPNNYHPTGSLAQFHIPKGLYPTNVYFWLWCESLGLNLLVEAVVETLDGGFGFAKLGVAAFPSAYASLLECLVCKDLGVDDGYPEVVFQNPARVDNFLIAARNRDRNIVLDVQEQPGPYRE